MILVTGGAGYIGSHTVVEMLAANHELLILDNFSNSSPKVIDAIERIAGKRPPVVEGDVRDKAVLRRIFDNHPIDGVIHFAGLKAVGESVEQPLRYYDNNVAGSLALFQAMAEAGCSGWSSVPRRRSMAIRTACRFARIFRCRQPTPTAVRN